VSRIGKALITTDNPFMDASEIDSARAQLPAVVFKQRLGRSDGECSQSIGSEFIYACTKTSTGVAAYYGMTLLNRWIGLSLSDG